MSKLSESNHLIDTCVVFIDVVVIVVVVVDDVVVF